MPTRKQRLLTGDEYKLIKPTLISNIIKDDYFLSFPCVNYKFDIKNTSVHLLNRLDPFKFFFFFNFNMDKLGKIQQLHQKEGR